MKPLPAAALLLSTGLLAAPAAAEGASTFRCGLDLLSLGESKAAAVQKCGRPVAKDSFCNPTLGSTGTAPRRRIAPNSTCETVDEWTYNPGYGQFMTTLRFESGRLVAISYGDRVR